MEQNKKMAAFLKARKQLEKAQERHDWKWQAFVTHVAKELIYEQLPKSVASYEEIRKSVIIFYVSFKNGVRYTNYNGLRTVVVDDKSYDLLPNLVDGSYNLSCNGSSSEVNDLAKFESIVPDLRIVDRFCSDRFFISPEELEATSRDAAVRRANQLIQLVRE